MRIDQQLAEKWIKPGSSVLDLEIVVTVNYSLIWAKSIKFVLMV